MRNKILIILSLLVIFGIVGSVTVLYKRSRMYSPSSENSGTMDAMPTDNEGLSLATVTIKTEKGTIRYKFYPKDAPKTTQRIAQLIQEGFYNSLTFHRVVPNFVVQGGDPTGTGTGGSGTTLPAEFNTRQHHEGTVAMARTSDPDSADAQFYIALGTFPHLDKKYTIFGKVIEGMDIVYLLQPGDKMLEVSLSH